jgi:cell division septation protein DedD
MNGGVPKTGIGLSGKLVLILFTVTAASGGFTLGYFVGKNVPPAPTLQPVPQKSAGIGAQVPSREIKPSEIAPPPAGEPGKMEGNPLLSGTVMAVQEQNRTPAERSIPRETKPANPHRTEAQTGGVSPGSIETARDRSDKEKQGDREQKARAGSAVYTVQVGAFNSNAEADSLKTKLEGIGYKPETKKISSKGNALFKVTVGEFHQKKEAEVLALKMKKAEGLNAFVTRKN